jgi:hypothetical protein
MSSNEEDQLAILNTELMEQLDNLKAQGLDEADLQAATTALLHSFGAKVQAATKKSQTATSGIGAGVAQGHTTIFAEQSEKIVLKSSKNEDIQIFAEKLRAKAVQTGRHATNAQLRAAISEKERAMITQAFRRYKFQDGAHIEDADKWLDWNNNEKLCDIFKIVFPKSEAQTDSQKLLNMQSKFKIHASKDAQHFFGFVADMQLVLHWEDRFEELMNLNPQAYTLLMNIILDQIMGKKSATCDVTKQLVADIKARAPSNLLELIDAITDEGQLLHIVAVDCERRGIPFLPFKRTEKEEKGGNEHKKPRLEGGGGETNYKEKRTQCNSCGKYHLGACDPNRGKGLSLIHI